MGFEQGLQAGLSISRNGSALETQATNRQLGRSREKRAGINDARRQKQRELTNLQTYGVQADGSYTARGTQLLQNKSEQALIKHQQNQVQMQANSLQQEAMKELMAQNKELQVKNDQVTDRLVTEDMTKGIVALTEGKFKDAEKILNLNPDLKDRLAKVGINDVQPVDWTRDTQLYADLPNFKMDKILNDTELIKGAGSEEEIAQRLKERQVKLNALNSSFFKAKNNKGEWELHSTEELFQRSNTKKYVSDETYTKAQKRFMKAGAILKYTVLSDADIELEAKQKELAGKTASISIDAIEEMVAKDMSPAEILTKLRGGTPAKSTEQKVDEARKVAQAKAEVRAKAKAEELKVGHEQAIRIVEGEDLADSVKDKLLRGEPLDTKTRVEFLEIEKMVKKKLGTKAYMYIGKKIGKSKENLGATTRILTIADKLISKGVDTKLDLEMADAFKVTKDVNGKTQVAVKFKSALGMALAKFIKSISGAAASDAERTFLKEVMQGGTYASINGIIASIEEFRLGEVRDSKSALETYKTSGFLSTWANEGKALAPYYKPFSLNVTKKTTTNTKGSSHSSNTPKPKAKAGSLSHFNGAD